MQGFNYKCERVPGAHIAKDFKEDQVLSFIVTILAKNNLVLL